MEDIMARNSPSDSIDVALQAMTDRRRRQVLRVLIEHDTNSFHLEELVRSLLDERSPGERSREADAARLGIELHHIHLPVLADAGIVEYEHRQKTVRYRPQERIERIAEMIEEIE